MNQTFIHVDSKMSFNEVLERKLEEGCCVVPGSFQILSRLGFGYGPGSLRADIPCYEYSYFIVLTEPEDNESEEFQTE